MAEDAVEGLLVRGNPQVTAGTVVEVTPDGEWWRYPGIEVLRLKTGERLARRNDAFEAFIVVVRGAAVFEVDGTALTRTPFRESPFIDPPSGAYVPPSTVWEVRAISDLEIAICTAPAETGVPAHAVLPDDVACETRGEGTNTRHVRDLLPESRPLAERLLVVEARTPGGCWSSYPPHKHDTADPPRESELEELYFYRIDPPTGFALQRVYTDDRALDVSMAPGDCDLVMVPRGYHPVGAPHGHDVWYLNVMAGPRRVWATRVDPDFAWLIADIAPNDEEA